MKVDMERLALFPKIDLHVHLDGSVKPETVIELAREGGHELPAWEPHLLDPYMRAPHDCRSLAEYLDKFHFVGSFLQTAAALERVAFELVEQSSRHNCKYIEVRFAPQLHRQQGLSLEQILRHVLMGLRRGEAEFGVMARCIVICMRHHADEINMEVIRAASEFIDQGVVAVDLAGSEAEYPAGNFERVFQLARESGMPITIHAGEAAGAHNIYDAVVKLGARRIGHGVRLKEDPDVFELVRSMRVPLELCPFSNIQTKAVADWEQYPIKEFLDRGLLVTVNSDNLTVSDTSMTKEYAVLRERLGLTEMDLARIIRNNVEAAFLQEEEKRMLRMKVETELDRLLVGP